LTKTTFRNCLFYDNGDTLSNGFLTAKGTFIIANCTFADNTYNGGYMFQWRTDNEGDNFFVNNIVADNPHASAGDTSPLVAYMTPDPPLVSAGAASYNLFWNNTTSADPLAEPPIPAGPTVRDCREACGNVNDGGIRNPPHNRKGAGR
jgi:hypothetical protein